MSTISGTSAYTPLPTSVQDALGTAGAGAKKPGNELDKDAFLQLLVAQLRYQDPTSPMDTSSFMAQTTQLTSVEKLTELAETSRSAFDTQQRLGAASLVGRQVAWTAADGTTMGGVVSAVTLAGPVPQLRVGAVDVPLDTVTAVVAAAAEPAAPKPTAPPAPADPAHPADPAPTSPVTPTTSA